MISLHYIINLMYTKKGAVVWTIVGLLLFILFTYILVKHTQVIENILFKPGPFAPVLIIAFYALLAPTPIISDPITLTVGVIYGPLAGFFISWIGNSLASHVEYYLGTKIKKATNFEATKERLPFALAKLPVNSPGFLIIGRMMPSYAGKAVSILAGVYKVPIKRYLWTTLVCNIPGSIILAYGGFHLVKIIKDIKLLT